MLASQLDVSWSERRELRKRGEERTGPEPHGLGVVVGKVVLDPRPVRVALAAGVFVVAQHLGDGKVP